MFRTAIAMLVAVALTATASHDPCPEQPPASPELTTPATGVSVSDGTVGGENPGIYYVDNDPCQLEGCAFSIWVYEESNGQAGLQRGDNFACDECSCHEAESDTIIL